MRATRLSRHDTLYARHFLYTVYAEEMHWLPQEGNPSGWIVKQDKSGKYFSDRYDAVANWFGVFAAEGLAAAGRVITPLAGKLEVELYRRFPSGFKAANIRRAEINRLAVAHKYAGTPALSLLLRAMYKHILGGDIDYLVCGIPAPTVRFAAAIGLRPLEPRVRFHYAKGDSAGAEIMFMDCRDKQYLKSKINDLGSEVAQNLKFFDEEV